jgi:branched-chain amino acid transport system substrate-binding protein
MHDDQRTTTTRRRVLQGGLGIAALAGFPAIARAANDTLRIGFVSPQSGPLGIFGEADGYVMELVQRASGGSIEAGGKRYKLELINKDTQSNPVRAAGVAKELINADKVDLVLSTSTPAPPTTSTRPPASASATSTR